MRNTVVLVLILALIFTATGCSCGKGASTNDAPAPQYTNDPDNQSGTEAHTKQNTVSSPIAVTYDSDDLDSSIVSPGMAFISLEGDSITLDGDRVTIGRTCEMVFNLTI